MQPGRTCPLSYRYPAGTLAAPASLHARTLYVAGGLYGNLAALDAIEALTARETSPPLIVFNGDFHWFDADADRFARVDARVARHVSLRGNVETELALPDDEAGCGCGYPDWVQQVEVDRSNEIIARLRTTATAFPAICARLAALPMTAVAEVDGQRIGIVHGDLESLAGWNLSQERLADPTHAALMAALMADARLEVVASSHTCLPVAQRLAPGRLVINNGAAGMPNFRDHRAGLITRIATTDAPVAPLYGVRLGTLRVDALAVEYDVHAFERQFLADWPPHSPAHASYWRRLGTGPAYTLRAAARL